VIGGATRWLASGEGGVAAYLSEGKSYTKGGSFGQPVAFIDGGERERGEAVPHVGDKAPASSRTVAPWHMPVSSVPGC
jgi:hypothetical protein